MTPVRPIVMIATVSAHERALVESVLQTERWQTVRVSEAGQVVRRVERNDGPAVLVIDAGMLTTPHDSQWRDLCREHPGLGTVVRCVRPRPVSMQRTSGRTLEVHPDDAQGINHAIESLCGPGRRPARSSLATRSVAG